MLAQRVDDMEYAAELVGRPCAVTLGPLLSAARKKARLSQAQMGALLTDLPAGKKSFQAISCVEPGTRQCRCRRGTPQSGHWNAVMTLLPRQLPCGHGCLP
jgi:hypothetical protein